MNLNGTTPAAPSGMTNITWQADDGFPTRNVSAYIPHIGGVNVQTGTSYTILESDNGKLIVFNSASAVAVTLSAASAYDSTFRFTVLNIGAGTVTITPTTSTINSVSTATFATNQGGEIRSDATNYWLQTGSGTGSVTHTAGALTADQPVFGNGSGDIKVGTKSGNTDEVATVSGTLTAGHLLTADASGNIVDGGATPATGTVTSVGLTVPSWLTVAGSPVTGSGTLAVTATTGETANQFLATPNGTTGAVGLRAIVPADLPVATTAALGAVKPDGTTITIASGVITAPSTSPLTTKGDLYGFDTANARVPVGSDHQVLTADSTASLGLSYQYAPMVCRFVVSSGVTGTNVARRNRAPRAGTLSKCKVTVEASDGTTDLTFTVNKNGTAVFTTPPTITHGASAGSISSFTPTSTITVAENDLFTLDISSGTSSWNITIDLES